MNCRRAAESQARNPEAQIMIKKSKKLEEKERYHYEHRLVGAWQSQGKPTVGITELVPSISEESPREIASALACLAVTVRVRLARTGKGRLLVMIVLKSG